MSGNKPATLFLILLSLAYAVLFYHAEMGVNLLIFDSLLIITALRCRPELAEHKAFAWSVGGMLFAASCVVIVHGNAALWAHHLSYLLVLGFAQVRELRFVWYGLLLGLITLARGPLQWFRNRTLWLQEVRGERPARPVWRYVRQGLPALVIIIPFLVFYTSGSQQMANGLSGFFSWMGGLEFNFTVAWSILLFVFALVLTAGLLFPRLNASLLADHQADFNDAMVRERHQRTPVPPGNGPHVIIDDFNPRRSPARKMMGLKEEYRQAIITFGLLNAVLAIVNFTDLAYVWISPGERTAATLSHYVHVGTWNLSISIGLAMLVVLYFFRGNLNFLGGDTILRPLTRLWLGQNALLALSVAVRNYHYIDAYGLALGRVYVGFVLLLMLFGLFTLLRKVDRRLSLSYLFQNNGLAVWLLLLAFGAVNWPGVITRYNLATQTTEEVDWDYLRSGLDRRNAFLLFVHPDDPLGMHSKSLPTTHRRADWRSWNYADWRNERAVR